MNSTTIQPKKTVSAQHPNKMLWEKGDFTVIASTMRQSGEELVKRIGITKGLNVLDLGCGDGTTAIPSARLGANVTGIDIASNLLAAARQRAKEEGLVNCNFEEGDAADLQNIENNSFDMVVSIFGAMFSSNPGAVAKEMVRVAKKGGTVVMGNWIPGDPTLVAQILKISSAYTPAPPQGFVSPMLWGVEKEVIDRFEQAGIPKENISFEREMFTFRAPYSPALFVQQFKEFYGPTMNAFDAATKENKEKELEADLVNLFESQNQSEDKSQTVIPATFLKVTVKV